MNMQIASRFQRMLRHTVDKEYIQFTMRQKPKQNVEKAPLKLLQRLSGHFGRTQSSRHCIPIVAVFRTLAAAQHGRGGSVKLKTVVSQQSALLDARAC